MQVVLTRKEMGRGIAILQIERFAVKAEEYSQ